MRKLKERFHRKHGIVSRIFSMVLALAMIVTMVYDYTSFQKLWGLE